MTSRGNITYDHTWTGDVSISQTDLTGTARAVWKVSSGTGDRGVTTDFGNVTRFQTVTTDRGCPTTGSVFAKWWQVITTVSKTLGDDAQSYEATHNFRGFCP